MNFRATFLRDMPCACEVGTYNETAALGVSRQNFLIDASLGVCSLPLAEEISLDFCSGLRSTTVPGI